MKLTEEERKALDRILDRLRAEGLRLSDEKLVMALVKAAAQLPEEDLLRLLKESLSEADAGENPGRRRV